METLILTEHSMCPTIIRYGSLFLASLAKSTQIKSLVPHTCDSVNADQKPTFHVRISHTKNGKKLVLSFTFRENAACFMVIAKNKHECNAAKLIAEIEAAAAEHDLRVINMVTVRPPPLEPVYYSATARRMCSRLHTKPLPLFVRKQAQRGVAAT